MKIQNVVIKETEPMRVAEATETIPGFGAENVSPVFVTLFREVREYLRTQAVNPGILYLEWHEDDPTRHVTELQLPLGS